MIDSVEHQKEVEGVLYALGQWKPDFEYEQESHDEPRFQRSQEMIGRRHNLQVREFE